MDRRGAFRKYLSFLPVIGARPNLLIAIADAYRDQGDWPNAAIYYRRALKADSGRRPIWVQLGHALKESGALEGALEAYREASALPGDDGEAPSRLGLLAKRLGRTRLALASFYQALREKPGQPDVHGELIDLMKIEFDLGFYQRNNPDVLAQGQDPLLHFLEHGRHEGRWGDEREARRRDAPARNVLIKEPEACQLIIKDMSLQRGHDAALLAAQAEAGRLKPHVLPHLEQLRGAGLPTLLVIAVDQPLELREAEVAAASGIIAREDPGGDFGAWADGLRAFPALFGAGLLVMANDSPAPTSDTAAVIDMVDRVRRDPADIVRLAAGPGDRGPPETDFLGLKPKALSSWAFQHFMRDVARIDDAANAAGPTIAQFISKMKAAALSFAEIDTAQHLPSPWPLGQAESTPALEKPKALNALPSPPTVTVSLSDAQGFAYLAPAKGVFPVGLEMDLSWDGQPLPAGGPDDWLFFAPREAGVCPYAIGHLLSAAADRPDVVLFYADDVAGGEPMLDRIRRKPDFDRTLLIAQDYIGAPVFVRRGTFLAVGGLDRSHGSAALFDLVLRVDEAGGPISRICDVLIAYPGKRSIADRDARRGALSAQKGFDDIELAYGAAPGLLAQRRRFRDIGHPEVSIVIPTRRACQPGSQETYLERLLESLSQAAWPMNRLTVIVGDDLGGEPDWAKRDWPFNFRRIETPRGTEESFNYARKMNKLWRAADCEQIIVMNDDVAPIGSDWLTALVGFAIDESVGGVGARLYYEDGSIQHAGIFPSFRNVVHAWRRWPAAAKTYQDWAVAQREWSMVTGAVFATRRSILSRLNGFDERFSLEFNDIDLCLRIRNLGYRIVYNPDAEFTHAEKASRGETLPPGDEVALFLSRWSRWLLVDPSSHPGLASDRIDLIAVADAEAWYSLS